MTINTDDRINELEIRLAFQEDALAALDKIVAQQSALIERLERMNRELNQRFRDLASQVDDGDALEGGQPPPHY